MKYKNILSISEVNPPTSFAGVMKVIRTIKVVTALPSVLEEGVTYLVGAQDLINITGLDGNKDQIYQIEATTINPATNNVQVLRFNGVSTNVYDFRYVEFGGSTSISALNATSSMSYMASSGTNSMEQTIMTIQAATGRNRTFVSQSLRGGANQITTVASYFGTGMWRDNSTNITSINILYSVISGGYGVGTVVRVLALQAS